MTNARRDTTRPLSALLTTAKTLAVQPLGIYAGEQQADTARVEACRVESLQYDSRKCRSGAVFVAIEGLSVDGHDFIPQAISNGARVVVCERLPKQALKEQLAGADPNLLVVHVQDSRKALAALAHAWYAEPSKRVNVFGVTGTNGKTTTTFALKALLSALGENVGIIGTTGNYIGTEKLPTEFTTPEAPELCTLFDTMIQRGATSIVMEVSSHALALSRVHGVRFAGAIFTNLTQDHLDFHGTMEQYASAKKMLFDMLPPEAVAVGNADDAYCEFMLSKSPALQRCTVGRTPSATVRISNEELGITHTRFMLTFGGEQAQSFETSLVGRFNVDNIAGCLALCHTLYASQQSKHQSKAALLSSLQAATLLAQPAPGRMQRIALPNGAAAVVDYAHTPDALEKALLACRDIQSSAQSSAQDSFSATKNTSNTSPNTSPRLVCVFGCGGNRDRTKRPAMGAIAARLADVVIVTSDNPRNEDPHEIVRDIVEGITRTPNAERRAEPVVIVERREAIRYALSLVLQASDSQDIVLIAGKGHEDYQLIGNEKLHFDDVEEVQTFIRASPRPSLA